MTTVERPAAFSPFVTSKLTIPPTRPNPVARPRLFEQLNTGLQRPLTLIAAPAGSGKTTLLSEWLSSGFKVLSSEFDQYEQLKTQTLRGHPKLKTSAAWVSLDPGDNDPARFWSYIVRAIQTVHAGFGDELLTLLQSLQSPSSDSIATALVAELAAIPPELVLALDDYHVIDTPAIHATLAFLLDHLPSHVHLVIISRKNPPLPLSRLRVRGQLTEIRADALRFTGDESATFLTERMGLRLDKADVAILEQRTEGWIAGLQLAALSMRNCADIPGFIAAFSGSNRYILDYLADEVFQRQPEPVLTFLLHTCILDRLCGELCDSLFTLDDLRLTIEEPQPEIANRQSKSINSQEMLEHLEQANLFIIPLDEERRWYRYHHLFAAVLRRRLQASRPELIAVLHRQAAAWYEQQGLADPAIRHALEGQDVDGAARLIEQVAQTAIIHGEVVTARGWLERLPDAVVRARPRLSVVFAQVLGLNGQIDAAEARLADAERAIRSIAYVANADSVLQRRPVALPDAMLDGEIALLRAMFANARWDVMRARIMARWALAQLPADHPLRGLAYLYLGVAEWLNGELNDAVSIFREGRRCCQATGDRYIEPTMLAHVAQIRLLEGRLREAIDRYQQRLALTEASGGRLGVPDDILCVGLGALLYERNDLDAATHFVEQGLALAKQYDDAPVTSAGLITLARVRQAQGDAEGAGAVMYAAMSFIEQRQMRSLWIARPVAAYLARFWLRQGDVAIAARLARSSDTTAGGVLGQPPQPEHPVVPRENAQIALARVLLAQGQPDDALALLERLIPSAESGGRMGHVLEMWIVQALAWRACGAPDTAHAALALALAFAAPEGYLRSFVDEGAPMFELLREAQARGVEPEYVATLLTAFPKRDPETRRQGDQEIGIWPDAHGSFSPSLPVSVSLVEPLSEREQEVLRLIAEGKSNTEIAQELVIGVSTVKTHINHIFSKLNATSRILAVARARELRLIP
jgi:LuxR family transcriptional regulator, maltose regulon positive regulatory protein